MAEIQEALSRMQGYQAVQDDVFHQILDLCRIALEACEAVEECERERRLMVPGPFASYEEQIHWRSPGQQPYREAVDKAREALKQAVDLKAVFQEAKK